MPQSPVAKCDPRLLDVVTWSVMRGIRMFQRVQVRPTGLCAIEPIPVNDFAVVVPCKATISVLNVTEDPLSPVKAGPQNFGEELQWWPDLTWGSFAVIAHMARVILTQQPKGLYSYMDLLPFDPGMPIGKVADAAQKSRMYQQAVRPMQVACRAQEEQFNAALRHAYCLFRRHAVPFWTSAGGGHPFFSSCELATNCTSGKGEIIGLIPLINMAAHSSKPNAVIGSPDSDMLAFLSQERGITEPNLFVLQATRDIHPGEEITVNKNSFYGFDEETFAAWFGFPFHSVK
jgi:hypothetical protein